MFKIVGLFTYIKSNRRKTAFLLILLFLMAYLFLFGGYLFFHKTSVPIDELSLDKAISPGREFGGAIDRYVMAVIWEAWKDFFWKIHIVMILVIIWVIIGKFIYKFLLMRPIHANRLTRKECPRAYNILETLSITAGIRLPALFLIETRSINAFAIGLNAEDSSIAVTQGLLDSLDDAELDAVLAHEVTHIKNGDTMTLVTAVLITGIMTYICELIMLLGFGAGKEKFQGSVMHDPVNGGESYASDASRLILMFLHVKPMILMRSVLSSFLMVIIWLSALMVRFAISKTREYLADAGAVELTKNPDALISALIKIDGNSNVYDMPSSAMQMCFDNPRTDFMRVFATHPSVEDRIRYLETHCGGRRPPEQKNSKRSFSSSKDSEG